jgi:hypothetical protein
LPRSPGGTSISDSRRSPWSQQASELRDGTRIIGEPKTYAGRRTVSMAAVLIGPLSDHLESLSEPGLNGAVFVGPKGGPLRRGNFNVSWRKLGSRR